MVSCIDTGASTWELCLTICLTTYNYLSGADLPLGYQSLTILRTFPVFSKMMLVSLSDFSLHGIGELVAYSVVHIGVKFCQDEEMPKVIGVEMVYFGGSR